MDGKQIEEQVGKKGGGKKDKEVKIDEKTRRKKGLPLNRMTK